MGEWVSSGLDISSNIIVISDDLSSAKEKMLNGINSKLIKIFEKDDFLLEDAKDVTKEAYIKEEKDKYILIIAKSFNTYAQNSLLKILEESPANTIFVIISNSKSNFLPTIRSRLPVVNLKQSKKEREIEINLSKMSLKDIFDFVKENQRVSKNELKELLQDIFYEAVHKYSMKFNEKELEVFENAIKLADLNTRAAFLLNLVLTTIIDREELKIKNEKLEFL